MPNPTLAERLREFVATGATENQSDADSLRALADEVEALDDKYEDWFHVAHETATERDRRGVEIEHLKIRINALEETLRSVRSTKGDRIETLEAALRKIGSEETGYEVWCDALEYARGVIEEMREMARAALPEAAGEDSPEGKDA